MLKNGLFAGPWRSWRRLVLPLTSAFALLVAVPGSAQVDVWNGGNRAWSNPSNWSGGVPNGPGITANIGTATGMGPITGTATVDIPVNLPNGISLGNGARGGLVVNSAANPLNAGTMDIGFSGPGTSTLTISGGGNVSDGYVDMGVLAPAGGSATVTGTGSQWNVSTQFFVGDYGQGSVTVQNGGVLNSTASLILGLQSGSAGTVTVTGSGSLLNMSASELTIVGGAGQGTLILQNGGVANLGGADIGGVDGVGPGTLTVTGAGSQLNSAGTISVGLGGQGTLTIQNGGVANLSGADIGGIDGVGPGTLTVTGAGSQLNSNFVNLGLAGQGSLTLQNGGIANLGGADIGGIDGVGPGTLTVTGPGSQLNSTGTISVGLGGQGTLTIQNGGVANLGGANIGGIDGIGPGTLTVTGAGSQLNSNFVNVGLGGQGTLTIQNGGVATASEINVGSQSGSVGTVAITGSGSQLSSIALWVGLGGQGSLALNNGGAANVDVITEIGFGSGSVGTLTVVGAGSQLNSGYLSVGDQGGRGALTIEGGGVANISFDTFVGSSGPTGSGGSAGTLEVAGAGSELAGSGDLTIGYTGQGTMTITAGAKVSDVNATIGAFAGSSGTVLVDAGTWNNTGALTIGTAGTGTVTIMDNGKLTAGGLTIGSLGSLILDPSTVYVNGNLVQLPGGLLTLDIAGNSPDLFSQLDISGDGLFQGTIDFDFVDGFAPATGESFDLINVLGADFSDANFQVEGLGPGFLYTDSFSDGSFTLVAESNGVSTSETPEPSPFCLLGSALVVLSVAVRRRNAKARLIRGEGSSV